jgi:hypothetical protein
MEKLNSENKKLQTQEIELQDRANKLNTESEMINREKIKANEDAMQELMKQEQELAMKMDYLRKTQEALFMEQWNKKHFEEQAQFNKKQAELYELQLKIKDAELRSSSKSHNETEDKEQRDLLQKKENELKAQIEAQRNLELIKEKMLMDSKSLPQPIDPEIPFSLPISPPNPQQKWLDSLGILRLNELRSSYGDTKADNPESVDALLAPLSKDLPGAPPVPGSVAETFLRLNGGVLRVIINALLDEKIIDSRNDLTIILNQQTFTVNGKVQPQNIQDEFKKRFLSRPKDHVIYSRHGGSTSAEIDIDDNPIGAEGKEKP